MKLSSPISMAPSILSADFARLGEEVRAVTKAGAQFIHVDVMDGHFVPNLTLGPDIVAALRRTTHLPLDVHLMIEAPERLIPEFVKAGAAIVTVHVEACVHLHRVLQQIRELGAKVGVSLNPATPLSALELVLPDVDLVLVMTVNPGFGGQKPIPAAIDKVAALRQLIESRNFPEPPVIEVDGGVKVDNVHLFKDADIFVSGSGIFNWPDHAESRPKAVMNEEELAASYSRVIHAFHVKLRQLRNAPDLNA